MLSLHGLSDLMQYLPILVPLMLLVWGLMIGALVHLLRRGKVRYGKVWMWILLIVFVQVIGPVLYFLIGKEDA